MNDDQAKANCLAQMKADSEDEVVGLIRDALRQDALQGYILTPTARDVLHRLADALWSDSPGRAYFPIESLDFHFEPCKISLY